MSELIVNNELCIQCGICSDVCPTGVVVMGDQGPRAEDADFCVRCGHCVAVCPQGALSHQKAPLEDQPEIAAYPVLDPETATRFLRSRRSVRAYKPESVPQEKLERLLDIARFAPTGHNTQGLSYLVISDQETLRNISRVTGDFLVKKAEDGILPEKYSHLVKKVRAQGKDIILRGAPHLLLALAPKSFAIGRDNSRFSFAYTELYATALGLGTCWAGLVEIGINAEYELLLRLLDVPAGQKVVAALMAGYPRVTYSRLADRDPLRVTWR
ncbi:MAG TPA: nitroreductase family protein [Patescibacteria group bacterium]|nr:nitroreductase family protein [Patescibacteria group bacterium]